MSNVNGTISQTNISIDDVKTVLYSNSNDLGTLCLNSSINPRSRHKPNSGSGISMYGTYQDAEYFARISNYGFTIKSFSNLLECCRFIFNHQSPGLNNFDKCFYDSKKTPTVYRLVDFSEYCHTSATQHWAYYLTSSNTIKLDPNDNIDYDVSTLYSLNVNSLQNRLLPCNEMRYNNAAYDSSNPDAYTLGKCKVNVMGFCFNTTNDNVPYYFIKTITAFIGGVTKDITLEELSQVPNAWYTSLEGTNFPNRTYDFCCLLLSPGASLNEYGALNNSHSLSQTFIVLPDIIFDLTKSKYTASTALSNVVISAGGYVYNSRFYATVTLTNSSNYKFITSIYPSLTLKIDYYGRNSTSPDRSQSSSLVEIQKNSYTIINFEMPRQTLGYDPVEVAKIIITYSIAPQNGNVVSKNITVNKPSGGWPTTPPSQT